MLTGTPPYAGDSPLSVAYRHVHDDVPAPSEVVHGIPAAVDDLTVRATRRDPSLRPADGGAFLADVVAARAALPAPALDTAPTLVVPRLTTPPSAKAAPGLLSRRPRRGVVAAIVIGVLALLALLGGWYLGSGRYTHAPSVLNLTQAAAEQKLDRAGLQHRIDTARAFSETVAVGDVAEQRPKPGNRVRRDGTVTLVLSKGPDRRVVPTVFGSTLPAAEQALISVGLRKGTVTERYSRAAKGQVVASNPPAGQKLRAGTPVDLIVSKGPEQLPVPDVQGKKQDEAVKTVTAAGFQASVVQVFSDTVPAGVVADQSPSQGLASRDSTITLSVSKGPELITVPDVTGLKRDDAVARIEALGLKTQVITPFGGGNKVHAQSPGGGSRVRKGSLVRLLVY